MAHFKTIALMFFTSCWFGQVLGGYLITTPWVYRLGSVQRLNVDLHGNDKMWKITATLMDPGNGKILSMATKTIPGNSHSTIDIMVPQKHESVRSDAEGRGNIKLQVVGVSQDGKQKFKKEQHIFLKAIGDKQAFFIQTEKSIYNPGETVRLRVIGLKHDLKPLEGKVRRISITNPQGVRMVQWNDVDFKNGIVNVEMPLSTQPVLGKWKIKATLYQIETKVMISNRKCPPPIDECCPDQRDDECNDDRDCAHLNRRGGKVYKCCFAGCDYLCVRAIKDPFEGPQIKYKEVEKIIIVKKYVLQKFKVAIAPPSFIAVDSGKGVNGTICARYNHGQPVSGEVKAVFDIILKEPRLPECPRIPPPDYECPDEPDHDCTRDDQCDNLGDFESNELYFCCRDGCDNRCVPAIHINLKETLNHASKSISTKIKGCFNFTFTSQELQLASSLKDDRYARAVLKISAKVTEDVTGVTESDITETKVEPYRVKVTFDSDTKYFSPGLPFNNLLHVTTPGGEPVNNELVTVKAQDDQQKTFFEKEYTVLNGKINYEIPTIPSSTYKVIIKAEQSKSSKFLPDFIAPTHFESLRKYSKSSSFLSLRRSLQPIKVGETAKISLTFTWSGDEEKSVYTYQLMCLDQIVVSGKQRLSSAKRIKPTVAEGFIEFPVGKSLPASSCRLLVYYVRKGGEVVADSMVIKAQANLKNQVAVRFNNNHRKPGENVQITIKAAPGSTVALSAIDKHLRQEVDDISIDKLLGFRSSSNVGWTEQRVRLGSEDASKAIYDAGLIYLSDLSFPGKPNHLRLRRQAPSNFQQTVSQQGLVQSKKSREVPETWLWTEETVSKITGERIITAKVPDSTTIWQLSAFAMSSSHGIGVAMSSTLNVSRPFFVSLTLPYAVIRGEKVSIATRIFSYMKRCSTVLIQLKQTADFQQISTNGQRLCICGNEVKSINHVIKPFKVGKLPITVTVKNVAPSLCKNPADEPSLEISESDSRLLRVEPEGESKEYTYSEFICLSGTFKKNVKLDLPRDVVPDSVSATLSVTGDVMGSTLTGFDKYVRLPTGCGEQNMVKFAPNVYVMQYLNSTNLKVDHIVNKSRRYLITGYQRELTYKRKDGSYSAFGDRDEEGSLWLTAFVLRSFAQARQYIFIDDDEIKNITEWIQTKQLGNGCFQKHGKLVRKQLKGGVSTSATLTAYIMISLLESNVNPKRDVIVKALRCIVRQQNSVTDSYSNAIIAYALTLANHPDRAKFLQRLASQAIVKDGKMHWERKDQSKAGGPVQPFHRSSSINIEMTGYALMAMIGDGTDSRVLIKARPIVKWLSSQRNALGGFSSTQDTCVALQALSIYGRYVYGELVDYMKLHAGQNHSKTWMVIHVDNKKGFKQNFRITHSRRLVLQRMDLPGKLLPTIFQIDAIGRGCALLQADVSYNTKTILTGPAFNLSANVRPRKDGNASALKTDTGEQLCRSLEINVCAQWREKDKSDMAVIEVKLVSGFRPDEESLERLMNRTDVGLMRFEIEENKVVLYFNEIKDVCLTFGIDQTSVVANKKPASVTVYDYYDTDKSASTLYTITDSLCATKAGA